MSAPDFVAVGHVTLDRFGDVTRPGGAALYAAVTAHRLGLSVGLLTSHADDFPLELLPPQIEVVTVSAPATTIFEHRVAGEHRVSAAPAVVGEHDDADGRGLAVHATARPIGREDVPPDWTAAPIVLLAPVLGEIDPLVATAFADAGVGAAAQGWLRETSAGGVIVPREWESPELVLGCVQALFLSTEDVRDHEAAALEWFERVPVGALTAGRNGALLFVNGERYEVPVRALVEVDATGAGDVFAAAFLVAYHRHGDPWEAAAAATCAAALSVRGEGWSAVPDAPALEAAVAEYHRRRDERALP